MKTSWTDLKLGRRFLSCYNQRVQNLVELDFELALELDIYSFVKVLCDLLRAVCLNKQETCKEKEIRKCHKGNLQEEGDQNTTKAAGTSQNQPQSTAATQATPAPDQPTMTATENLSQRQDRMEETLVNL
ncbi:hypothetical protein PanWU01x14_316310 [Parasponia andersonii]|uniref:Uncharacterized protein n=1 Tax=Parasponia andersonii TaxID=3476 RepID=A0A2P5ANC4_PARAD|nr:hypothetical protein PanWU01x14_316310 [Parasponia andersonii]